MAPPVMLALVGVLFSGQIAFSKSYGGFYRRPNLPAPAIADVIRIATAPSDVFAGMDMDWNSTIPYYAQRRAIMMFQSHTENAETFGKSLANLKPASLAALLVAAPHRTSMPFLVPRLTELEMEMQPIASSQEGDLYLRRDLLLSAAARLNGRSFPGVTLKLPAPLNGLHDLTTGAWPAQLGMMSPAPHSSRGEFAIGLVELESASVISVQAPTEMLIRPPAGAKRIQVRCRHDAGRLSKREHHRRSRDRNSRGAARRHRQNSFPTGAHPSRKPERSPGDSSSIFRRKIRFRGRSFSAPIPDPPAVRPSTGFTGAASKCADRAGPDGARPKTPLPINSGLLP